MNIVLLMEVTGVLFSIVGTTLLALNIPISRWAYLVMLGGSVTMTIVSVKIHNIPEVGLWGYYTAVNLLGIWRWIVKNETAENESAFIAVIEDLLDELAGTKAALSCKTAVAGSLHEQLMKTDVDLAHYRDLELPLRTNSYEVEQKKRLRAYAALRTIAAKGDDAMTDITAIKKLAEDTLRIIP